MKKFLVLFVMLLAVVVFGSCSSNDVEEMVTTTDVIRNDRDGKTLNALKDYNDVLLQQCDRTRGGNGWLVAHADIKGAFKGINVGHKVAGLFGAATGGVGYVSIVAGAGLAVGSVYSYMAYKRHSCEYAIVASELYDYTMKIINNKYIGAERADTTIAKIDDDYEVCEAIELPQDFGYLKNIGVDHNKILASSNVDGNLPVSNYAVNKELKPVFMDEVAYSQFNEAINSAEMNEYFNTAIEDFKNGTELEDLDCSDRVKQALQGYLDLFQTYPENVDDLVEIANGYIKIIEENHEFTKEEKEMIYAAIMVSVYSPQLWYNLK